MDNKSDWELVHDRIDIEGGRWVLIGDKAAPYGVVAMIIFVYEERGGCIDVRGYLYDECIENMDIFVVIVLWWDY